MTKEFKYEMLIRRSKELALEYDTINIKLTIRQMYYRLVSALDIEHNRSQYVYFDNVLTKYRQQNLEFADLFKDEAREIINKSEVSYPYWQYSELINNRIDKVKTDYPQLIYNENLLQDKINVILLEKNALKDIFELSVTPNTILIVAKGINSFTQMNDLRKLIENDERELKLYIFTDFDDTGYLIQDNFIKQMEIYLGITFDSIERIALTQELIKKHNIAINFQTKKVKQAKSTHRDYGLPYFVELDAIEPRMLMKLVKDTCEQNFDNDLWESIDKALTIRNRRIKTKYFKELKKIDLTKI